MKNRRAAESRMLSIASVDIETTHVNANFGVILCGVVKPDGEEPIIFRGDKLCQNWKRRRSDDSQVVKALIECLNSYDIWVIHNGKDFDLKFLRTRAMKWGLLQLEKRKMIDPVLIARQNLRMSHNSLDQIAQLAGCNTKTKLDPDVWMSATLDGCTASMEYIVQHCVEDTRTLEKVFTKMKPFLGNINSYGSAW